MGFALNVWTQGRDKFKYQLQRAESSEQDGVLRQRQISSLGQNNERVCGVWEGRPPPAKCGAGSHFVLSLAVSLLVC